ncbi:MAG: 4Fe-4S ferredoxin, partial [Candidatus Electrothrix sp. ATG1]|nr:4Fe-4S ferredoxin [Candidatus Electrothrix sp. ATG1]
MKKYGIHKGLHQEVEALGAKDMELCMQCGVCAASCPLSDGTNSFPRKIYRYLQLGLRDKLLASPEPWLCYYCGDCNAECPRGAEPAETMMAARRWLTTEFDRTGLAKKLYLSKAWEIGSLVFLSLAVIFLFVFFHGPVITDRVAVNTFAPVLWIEIGDLLLVVVLSSFLFMNVFRMYRFIMGKTSIPIGIFVSQAKEFLIHFATQKRWGTCAASKKKINSRWIKHFLLVTGYMTKLLLIVVFLRWFQRDTADWHISSLFGYYAAGTIMYFSGEMLYSRYKKKEESLHRYSHATDWLFLILLFLTSLSGTIMHMFRMV